MFIDDEETDDAGSWATYKERADDTREYWRRDEEEYQRNLQDSYDRSERRICPDCNGTNISPYAWDGGGCPHCILGYVD